MRMNQFGPITLDIENFLELLKEGSLSPELCLRWTLNAFLGNTLAKSLEVSMSFPFRNITICYRDNKVSIIFLASRKNYIHKLLPVATASTMMLRLLKLIFLYQLNIRNYRHFWGKSTIHDVPVMLKYPTYLLRVQPLIQGHLKVIWQRIKDVSDRTEAAVEV